MTDAPDERFTVTPFRRGPSAEELSSDRHQEVEQDLPSVCASELAAREPSARPWLVRDMIPDHTVTLLFGDGGTGKSLMALQLAVAVASAGSWFGTLPEMGTVVYLSAEDDLDEIHRRLVDIAAGIELDLNALRNLHVVPMAGKDAVMVMPDRRAEAIQATPLWQALAKKVAKLRPRLVILDNLADVFGGNENARPQVRQFVGMLRGLAIENRLAVVLLAHPSVSGLTSGSGTSGSTAWSNSVRSRLYLDRAKGADGEEADPNARTLKVLKANYSPVGIEIRMVWDRGRFKLDGRGPSLFDRAADDAKADRIFLAVLTRLTDEGRDVSDKRSPSFAPAVFAKQPDREGCGKQQLEDAMNRLLASRKIKIEPYGPPSRRYTRIATVDQ